MRAGGPGRRAHPLQLPLSPPCRVAALTASPSALLAAPHSLLPHRLKVFQLGGIAALAVPINTFLATGEVAGTQAVMAAALVVGASVASGALWYYSRRYLGELALLPPAAPGQPPRLRLSVLDFWGNREVRGVGGLPPPCHRCG